MGKYLLSSLLFFSYCVGSNGFFNSFFKSNQIIVPISDIKDKLLNNNKIFNPFEKSDQLSLTENIINSCESPNGKIINDNDNLLKINLLIDSSKLNDNLPFCESKPFYLKTVPEITSEIRSNLVNEITNIHIIDKINRFGF